MLKPKIRSLKQKQLSKKNIIKRNLIRSTTKSIQKITLSLIRRMKRKKIRKLIRNPNLAALHLLATMMTNTSPFPSNRPPCLLKRQRFK